jgi:hypothetical protein
MYPRISWELLEPLAYRVLVRKAEGKRQLGRSRRRWEDHVKVDL